MILNRIGQYDPFHTTIDKFYFVFNEFWCIWVLYPRIWNVLWMRFSKKNLLHQLNRWKDHSEIPKKLLFSFILGLKICYVQTDIKSCRLTSFWFEYSQIILTSLLHIDFVPQVHFKSKTQFISKLTFIICMTYCLTHILYIYDAFFKIIF